MTGAKQKVCSSRTARSRCHVTGASLDDQPFMLQMLQNNDALRSLMLLRHRSFRSIEPHRGFKPSSTRTASSPCDRSSIFLVHRAVPCCSYFCTRTMPNVPTPILIHLNPNFLMPEPDTRAVCPSYLIDICYRSVFQVVFHHAYLVHAKVCELSQHLTGTSMYMIC
jgi:hypothetical protein